MNVYQYADAGITEEAAADFVARVTGHIPPANAPGTHLPWPLVVGIDPRHPGVPGLLLDGSAAQWSLPDGDDCVDRMEMLDNDLIEITRYRNGREIGKSTHPLKS